MCLAFFLRRSVLVYVIKLVFGIGTGTAGMRMRCLYVYSGVYCVWGVGIVTDVGCSRQIRILPRSALFIDLENNFSLKVLVFVFGKKVHV